jgi:hypothetical protein
MNFAGTPDSWNCIDCGVNTAPGMPSRGKVMRAFDRAQRFKRDDLDLTLTFSEECEVYNVKESVWRSAGVDSTGGCLCIGCLEKRIGRRLTRKDFDRKHPFNRMPGTKRLRDRRDVRSQRIQLR